MQLDLFMPTRKETLNGTLHEIDGVVSKCIKGIAIDATIIAILSATGLTLVHIKFAVFLGLFAGVCNVIPYFGPFIGMIPAFLVGTLTTDLLHGAMAVVVMFIIQQFDSNLIYPKVVGKQTGLHPLYVLLAVTIGGGVGGLLGMVLAVPIAGVIKLFFDKYVDKKQAARSKETENSEQTTSAENSEDSASTV
jgi:predicted PurR-regulated permease PerM